MRTMFKSLKWGTVALAVILTVLGLFFLLMPDEAALIVCMITGAALCLWGVIRIVGYFSAKAAAFGSYGLVTGVALLMIGILILVDPGWLSKLLAQAFGLVLVVDGAMKVQHAVDMRRMRAGHWWIILLAAVLVIAVGIVAFFNPFSATHVLMRFLGVCLVVDGVIDLVTILYVSGYMKAITTDTDLLS